MDKACDIDTLYVVEEGVLHKVNEKNKVISN